MPQLKTTKLVRKIMRKHDRSGCFANWNLYTNKHKNSRTVKCYGTGNVAGQQAMINEIETALVNAGVYDAQCRVLQPPKGPWSSGLPSVIIQLPLE